jgi:predicted GNAT family acetyltransferase
VLRTGPTRVLSDRDLGAVRRILDTDPVAHVMVASRVEVAGLDPWRLGAEMWGYAESRELSAVCLAGANLVPVGADQNACRAFAERARRQGRRCSSIVGDADAVLDIWGRLAPIWDRPRDVREEQPLMLLDGDPQIEPDPDVRLVRPDELDILLPAAIAMYTEEIGFSPAAADGGALYRARVAELIAQGRAFARIESGRVLFKAEVGAVSREACQVQGVWTAPEMRGRGLGTAGTAAVAFAARHTLAPLVSLYVNEHNAIAQRAYARVGFRRVGTFASVLF